MTSYANKFQELASLQSLPIKDALQAINGLNKKDLGNKKHEFAAQLSQHRNDEVKIALCTVSDVGKEAQINLAEFLLQNRKKQHEWCEDFAEKKGDGYVQSKYYGMAHENEDAGKLVEPIDPDVSRAVETLLKDETLCDDPQKIMFELLQDYSSFVDTEDFNMVETFFDRKVIAEDVQLMFASRRGHFEQLIEHPSLTKHTFEAIVKLEMHDPKKVIRMLDHPLLNDNAKAMIAQRPLDRSENNFVENVHNNLTLANMATLPQEAHLPLAARENESFVAFHHNGMAKTLKTESFDYLSGADPTWEIKCHDVAVAISKRNDISSEAQEYLVEKYTRSPQDNPVLQNLSENPNVNSPKAIIGLLDCDIDEVSDMVMGRLSALKKQLPKEDWSQVQNYLNDKEDKNCAFNTRSNNLAVLDI